MSSQQFVTGKNVYCTSFRANKFIFYIQSKCVDMQGPVPAGEKHDRTMFCGGTKEEGRANWDRSAVYFKLNEGQKLIADSAYDGIPEKVTISRKGQSRPVRKFINRAKARGESYHSRLTQFRVLTTKFRHGSSTENKIALHKMCAEAVSVVVQFDLKYHPLMQM